MKNQEKNTPLPLEEALKNVSPEEYDNFIEQIQLESIFLSKHNFDRALDSHLKDNAKLNISSKTAYYTNCEELQRTFGSIEYELKIVNGDYELFNASFEFTAEFTYENQSFDENTFSIFLNNSLQAMLHPYIRAYISHLMSESDMGHFTLPMMKMFTQKEESKEPEKL